MLLAQISLYITPVLASTYSGNNIKNQCDSVDKIKEDREGGACGREQKFIQDFSCQI
jgi:hypothetical protein